MRLDIVRRDPLGAGNVDLCEYCEQFLQVVHFVAYLPQIRFVLIT